MDEKHMDRLNDALDEAKKDSESRGVGKNSPSMNCCSQAANKKAASETLLKENGKVDGDVTMGFALSGMSCSSCAEKIEKVLSELPGVKEARVNFLRREAVIVFNRDEVSIDDLKAVVETQGYRLIDEKTADIKKKDEDYNYSAGLKPYLIGMASSAGVVGFYLGLLTLTSDWYNARLEFREYGVWIITLALGLGLQVTLFSLYRAWRRGESMKAAKYSLAASSGMSTTAMAACCAHYLALILPALGLPFLSAAAASLANYQVYFFMAGVISNLFGIGVMLRMMYRSGMIQMRFLLIQSPLFFKK